MMCFNKQYKILIEVVADMRNRVLARSFVLVGVLFLLALVCGVASAQSTCSAKAGKLEVPKKRFLYWEVPTPRDSGTGSISGTITYGNAIGAPTPPRFVPNVQLTGAGSTGNSATSGSVGTYMLTGFGAGAYTVTPSKTGDVNGITSFDAARIAQHVSGSTTLTGNQLIVADTSGNGQVTSFDAAQIAQYASGGSGMQTGTWKFLPQSRNYETVTTAITGQDYQALLMGEVSGNWTPPAPQLTVLYDALGGPNAPGGAQPWGWNYA